MLGIGHPDRHALPRITLSKTRRPRHALPPARAGSFFGATLPLAHVAANDRSPPRSGRVQKSSRPCENSDTVTADAILERPQVTSRSIIMYSAPVATHSCVTAERWSVCKIFASDICISDLALKNEGFRENGPVAQRYYLGECPPRVLCKFDCYPVTVSKPEPSHHI
jgi:hypothetical protein